MIKRLCASLPRVKHVRLTLFVVGALFLWAQAANAQTVIDTIQQLEAINGNLSGNYVLGANINASGFNFAPIGDFTGSLQGDGYSISNLTITGSPGPFGSGLFGAIGAGGNVNNIVLTNETVNASGGTPMNSAAGGLAAVNFGTITGSSVAGSVVSTAPAGSTAFSGGLVAENLGGISNSSSTASVSGGVAGGLVGTLNGGSITQSYATGTVTAGNAGVGNNGTAGGLVGVQLSNTTISDSYATGAVNVGSGGFAGGLVGQAQGTINQTYATGNVSNSGRGAGGLVAQNFNAAITSSYWDMVTTGQPTSAGGIGQMIGQLQSGLPGGFDPAVWASSQYINNGYPFLLSSPGFTAGVFQALSSAYVAPGTTTLFQLQQSQQAGITAMSTALAVAQSVGTSLNSTTVAVKALEIYNVGNDLYTLFQVLTVGAASVDPFLPIIICPQGVCMVPISEGQSVEDPYETFAYSLTLQVPDADIPFFGIGNDYFINTELLGTGGFSSLQVTNITGDDITFQVNNISDLSQTPLPSSELLFASGLILFFGAGLIGRTWTLEFTRCLAH